MRFRFHATVGQCLLLGMVLGAGCTPIMASDSHAVMQVSGKLPVVGKGTMQAASRPLVSRSATAPLTQAMANPWQLQATLPGAVIHDLSFPTAQVGFAAAELGQVWKTADGGSTWTMVMNLGFPYYWYGVHALNTNDVVVSGFNNSNFQAVLRWSHDGGATWGSDVIVSSSGWSGRVRFADSQNGLVLDLLNLNAPNAAHYTTDGGATGDDWTAVVPDPNGGWFGNQFSLLPDLRARASGITYCDSPDGGANWSCGPSVDSVFDGPTYFADANAGWVGGGEISPSVEGWVHRTTDGGKTWSDRTLDVDIPIREILFLNPRIGWAAGGNIYSNVGGIYASRDGGQTWSLDLDSKGVEMDACATLHQPSPTAAGVTVWCAGYDASFNGVVYKLQKLTP